RNRRADGSCQPRVEFQPEVEGAEKIVRRKVVAEDEEKGHPQQREEHEVGGEEQQRAADHPAKLGATFVMKSSMVCITRLESWLLKSNQSNKRSAGSKRSRICRAMASASPTSALFVARRTFSSSSVPSNA